MSPFVFLDFLHLLTPFFSVGGKSFSEHVGRVGIVAEYNIHEDHTSANIGCTERQLSSFCAPN